MYMSPQYNMHHKFKIYLDKIAKEGNGNYLPFGDQLLFCFSYKFLGYCSTHYFPCATGYEFIVF